MRGRPSWLTSSADESANVIESRPCQGRGGTGSSAITGSRRSPRCLAISGAFRAEVVLSPTSQWGAVGAAGGGDALPHSLELADLSGRKRDAPPRAVGRLIAAAGARPEGRVSRPVQWHRRIDRWPGRCMCTRHLRVPAEAGTSRVDSVTTALMKVGRDGRRASALPPAVGGSERGPIGTRRGKPPRRPRGSLTLAA
jgi:hypothetical protein